MMREMIQDYPKGFWTDLEPAFLASWLRSSTQREMVRGDRVLLSFSSNLDSDLGKCTGQAPMLMHFIYIYIHMCVLAYVAG